MLGNTTRSDTKLPSLADTSTVYSLAVQLPHRKYRKSSSDTDKEAILSSLCQARFALLEKSNQRSGRKRLLEAHYVGTLTSTWSSF